MNDRSISYLLLLGIIIFQIVLIVAEAIQVNFYLNGNIVTGKVVDISGQYKTKLVYFCDGKKIEKQTRLKPTNEIKIICLKNSKKHLVYHIPNFILTDAIRLIIFIGLFFIARKIYREAIIKGNYNF
jgi:hypothetical protein